MQRNLGLGARLLVPATVLTALACGGGDLVLPGGTPAAAGLVLVSGDDQTARAGEELPGPLVVRLVDESGNGVQAGSVTWETGTGGGSVSPTTTETDEDGLASARLTLGPSPGPNTVRAMVSGLGPVTFSAIATGGGGGGDGDDDLGPDHLVFQVEPSDATEDEPIRPAVTVAVVDRDARVVPDFKIKIAVVLSEGSGELKGKRETDTKDGIAVFEDLKVDQAGEGKVLRALAPEEAFLGIVESRSFRVAEEGDD